MSDKSEIVTLHGEAGDKLQAGDWLAMLDRGNLTAEERAAFTRWLGENPENRRAIKELAAFWYDLNGPLSRLAGQSIPKLRSTDDRTIWGHVLAISAGFFLRFRFAVVTVALAAFAIPPLIYYASLPGKETGYFATNIGETRTIQLTDGSQLTLNTSSIAEQDFSRDERIIRLVSGEAIFDVAHEERRPFLVYAADGVIRAVGTRFAVRVEPHKVSVAVTEGRIALQRRLGALQQPRGKTLPGIEGKPAALESVILAEGEAAEIDRMARAAKMTVSESELAERLSWAEGQLVFYDRELQFVIEEVARYTPVTIEIEGETLKRKKITGVLEIGDVDVMLDGIEGALGIKVKRLSPDLVSLSAG